MEREKLKSVIESLLLVSEAILNLDRLSAVSMSSPMEAKIPVI